MASGEAEPLQYTTTVLRVSIHCEGCKKKVKKVLHNIEGVYKVTVDAAQHKVTVTGSVGADALIRRLYKAGKQAALWAAPAPAAEAAEAKKPEVAAAPPLAGEGCNKEVTDKADKQQPEAENSEKDKGKDKKPEKAEGAKQKAEAKKDGEEAEPKEKGSPEPAKEAAAAAMEAGGEEASSGKKGKKKKNKQKDGGEGEAAAEKPPQPPMPAPTPAPGPERPHGAFPYYAPQPVMSYNVAHPSSSVSYYAPTPVVPMQPMPMPPPPPPPQMPYGYSPYPPMMPPPPEFLYGPPGMRSSPPQESYNMFNEDNANSCILM